MNRIVILTALALGTLGLIACGGGGEGGEEHSSGGEDLSSFEGPITSTDLETGAAVYAANCEGCHPGGGEGSGPSITDHAHSAAQMRHQVRMGEERMPAFGEDKISGAELEALLAHLQTMGAIE